MPDKPMDHATKASFWKKLRKTKSTTFAAPPQKDGKESGLLAALAEHELDLTSPQLAEPPRRASLYSLQRNPTSEDLPTLTISDTSAPNLPSSQTLPTRTPSSFDMLFSRSSSSNRSRYAFTPPLQRSDTENSMNPRSLFEIRAFANALQRLHSKDDSDAGLETKDGSERKRRTLKSAKMRPTTSASTTDSSTGPFTSTSRYPLTPYPPRPTSLWGLWDHHDSTSLSADANDSGNTSPTTPSSSGWPSSANTSATSVALDSVSPAASDRVRGSTTAKWYAAKTNMKSPNMVKINSTAGQSVCGEYDVLVSTPVHEVFVPLDLSVKDSRSEGGDFASDVHKRLKEIMGLGPDV